MPVSRRNKLWGCVIGFSPAIMTDADACEAICGGKSGGPPRGRLGRKQARNPVDRNRDRVRQGCRYRSRSNRLELGEFIAHLIRASRADAVPLSHRLGWTKDRGMTIGTS